VIAVRATAVPTGTSGSEKRGVFGKDLIEDVIPFVQSKYACRPIGTQRAIAAFRWWRSIAWDRAQSYSLFSYGGGFSSGLRPADFDKTFAAVAAPIERGERQAACCGSGAARRWRDDRIQGVSSSCEAPGSSTRSQSEGAQYVVGCGGDI